MEDGVSEVQSFLPPLTLNSEDGSNREDGEEKEDGFVSTEKVEEMKQEDLGVDEHSGKDFAAKDEGKGGLINNLISSLVSPLSPRTGIKATEHESGNGVFSSSEEVGADAVDGVEDGERGGVVANSSGKGGLISNIVSNFFHHSEAGDEGVGENVKKDKEDEEDIVDEKIKRVKTEDCANGGGGSIIRNIVSHLPASLPDDGVPTADEASILINSLVRD